MATQLAAWVAALPGLGEARRRDARRAPGSRNRTDFLEATFAIMGRIAKADGRVSEAEIAVANRAMARLDLPAPLRETARQAFARGKSPTFPLEQTLERLADACSGRRDLARVFVEIQIEAASADGAMQAAKRAIVERLCKRLGITASEASAMESLARGIPPAGTRVGTRDAYAALGLGPEADDAELERAYRRLMSQHHPDRLLAQGLPEEMVRLATRKTQEIRAAYERARAARTG